MSGAPAPAARRACWLVFAGLLASYLYFFQGGGWNPNSRLDLTRALAERGTIAIDAYSANTDDWSRHGGRTYTNKAPGLSLLSVPFYAIATPVAAALTSEPTARLRIAGYLTNACVNALPSAALGALVFVALGWIDAGSVRGRAAVALLLGLGTLSLPYATAYYAHQPAAAASFTAFAALWRSRVREDPRRLALVAGAAAGAAVLLEMSTALCVMGLGAASLADARARRALPYFVAGGLPFAIFLGAYDQAAFGSPFSTHVAHANPDIEVRIDGALFGFPGLESLFGLSFSPFRGLFFSSPVLLLALLGMRELWGRDRFAAAVCGTLPLAFFLLIASFHAWRGGWAPGPRYLIPVLPFLFLPVGIAARRMPALATGLGSISLATMLAITLVAVEIPPTIRDPIFGFVAPMLVAGRVSANSQELDAYWFAHSYADFEAPATWASFNLGELLWPASVWSVVPLLAVWAAIAALLLRLPGGASARARTSDVND